MTRWIKLEDYRKNLGRGDLIKFSASYPFEEKVVMMVCENRQSEAKFNLITITGYKAGINPYQILPDECLEQDNVFLDIDWLVRNWTKWVWPDGNINEVWVRPNLDASELN